MVLKKSFLDEYKEIAREWDYAKNSMPPDCYAPYSNKKVWWLCPKGHSYECSIDKRTSRNQNCPYCSGKKVLPGYNDLKTLRPDLASEWDYEENGELRPEMVAVHSNKIATWKCSKCGRIWKTKINDRSNGRGCSVCSVEKRIKTFRESRYLRRGVNDVVTLYPELVKEWDIEKNGEKNRKTTHRTVKKKYGGSVLFVVNRGAQQ